MEQPACRPHACTGEARLAEQLRERVEVNEHSEALITEAIAEIISVGCACSARRIWHSPLEYLGRTMTVMGPGSEYERLAGVFWEQRS